METKEHQEPPSRIHMKRGVFEAERPQPFIVEDPSSLSKCQCALDFAVFSSHGTRY